MIVVLYKYALGETSLSDILCIGLTVIYLSCHPEQCVNGIIATTPLDLNHHRNHVVNHRPRTDDGSLHGYVDVFQYIKELIALHVVDLRAESLLLESAFMGGPW